ncbi:hypothetical protein M407DRAFT_244593 [Tulasnella calospora MUT 4182]|uniref:Uncharacterized protein n=1 Tax=Tulasnella calospora MUT 4182 TaxID=1051891 RepID=A0A0C3Q4S9_9AGAM|nr:hypothetical protein M407DRAFT_244593 [Tulasnella calospora MUT 4182]
MHPPNSPNRFNAQDESGGFARKAKPNPYKLRASSFYTPRRALYNVIALRFTRGGVVPFTGNARRLCLHTLSRTPLRGQTEDDHIGGRRK